MRFLILILLTYVLSNPTILDNYSLIIEKSGTKYNAIIIDSDKYYVLFKIGESEYEINCKDIDVIYDNNYHKITDLYCESDERKIISPFFFGFTGLLHHTINHYDDFNLDYDDIHRLYDMESLCLIIGSVFLYRELKPVLNNNLFYFVNPSKTNPHLNLSFKF